MKKSKVQLVEFSPELEDGHRNTLSEKTLATCTERGTAELIAMYLREGAYKKLLSYAGKNGRIYALSVV